MHYKFTITTQTGAECDIYTYMSVAPADKIRATKCSLFKRPGTTHVQEMFALMISL